MTICRTLHLVRNPLLKLSLFQRVFHGLFFIIELIFFPMTYPIQNSKYYCHHGLSQRVLFLHYLGLQNFHLLVLYYGIVKYDHHQILFHQHLQYFWMAKKNDGQSQLVQFHFMSLLKFLPFHDQFLLVL